MQRRSLDLRDADAVIAEIRRLRGGEYAMLGKWNLTQICEHLAATLRLGLDGAGWRMPRVLRALVFGPMVRHVIRTGRMRPGIPAPKEIIPTSPGGVDDPAVVDSCIALLERARDTPGPLKPLPMADLTLDEWRQLNWVHASHHLGFLVPKEPAPSPGASSAEAQPA